MEWLPAPQELRHTMRVRAKGSVRLHCGSGLVRGRIQDVGVGGVRLHADLPLGISHLAGRCVAIDLRFDRRTARWFALDGHIKRVAVASKVVVVELDRVPTDYEDCIQDQLLAAVEHDELPRLILVDTDAARRAPIANAFRRAGRQVIEVTTPLEAIVRLGEQGFEPEMIAISDTFPESVAEDLRGFVSARHPRAHIVAIGGPRPDVPGADWLGWADTDDVLSARIDRMIEKRPARRP